MERLGARASSLPSFPARRFPAQLGRGLARGWQGRGWGPSIPAVVPGLSIPAVVQGRASLR